MAILAALERAVHREEALVGGVHRGEDVEVGRKLQLAVADAFVSLSEDAAGLKVIPQVFVRFDGVLGDVIPVPVQKLEEVAEYLGAVAAVDFLDDEIDVLVRIVPRLDICVRERLRHELVGQFAFFLDGLVRTYEGGVVAVRVECRAEGELFVSFHDSLDLERLAASRRTEKDFLNIDIG